MSVRKKIPRRYQPRGFEILYEDEHIVIGNKVAGLLTVGALYDRVNTVHGLLNEYVRKGNSKSRKCVFVVHRIDRETSGVLIFAKSERVRDLLKDHWKDVVKIYNAVVHGRLIKKEGMFSSCLVEDEDYVIHLSDNSDEGKLAHTVYEVVRETSKFSLVRINLLTGRKNQIRVHFADAGHPVVGDTKYGRNNVRYPRMVLHASSIAFCHPVTGDRLFFEAPLPEIFFVLTPERKESRFVS